MSDVPNSSARALRTLCDEIDAAIALGGLPATEVNDLKRAIDETRMRVWASMEAARSGDPAWVKEFWWRRVSEACLAMVQRVERGEVDPRSARAGEVRAAAERLVRSLSA